MPPPNKHIATQSDHLELEGIKVALDSLRGITSLAIAVLAALVAYGAAIRAAILVPYYVPAIVLLSIAAVLSTTTLMLSCFPLREGRDPVEGSWFKVATGVAFALLVLGGGAAVATVLN